jgi:phage terminase large subunit GpA-like protein
MRDAWAHGLTPEPRLTVSEWAQQHRILSPTASAEPGPWRNERTPYLRDIMDCLSVSRSERRIVFMKGSQLGATECGNNWLGYVVHHAPGPMLFVEPTVDLAKSESKQRVAPMIEETHALRELVAEPRARDSGNTILLKEFPGGILAMTGANSAKALRRMPVRYLFLDEVDGYPGDVGGEGDPVAIAEKRTSTFPRRKIFLVSTPTVKGISRIEKEFLASDQRRYFVPCPLCGAMDWIRWENIRWEEAKPETAKLACLACGGLIEEWHKAEMLRQGEWRPTAPGDGRTAGFHLSGLYSPLGWTSWAECVAEFLQAKENPQRLQTWVNTVLGETWEERGESVEAVTLISRAEQYPAEVPHGVGVLVAAVDVQGDRLEVAVKGYGAAEESWLIAFHQIHGDPAKEATWFELDRFLGGSYTHESGQELRVECVTVDTGGLHTEEAYQYCRSRLGQRIFAIKGGGEQGKPLVGRPSRNNRYRVPLFVLCVDTGKETVYGRLRIGTPGPGYMHLPDWIDEEYVAQLTAEKAIRKYVKGRGAVKQWVKIRERNEALDLEVYCLAALSILGTGVVKSLPERAATFSRTSYAVPPEPEEPPEPPISMLPRRRGWIDGWRGLG